MHYPIGQTAQNQAQHWAKQTDATRIEAVRTHWQNQIDLEILKPKTNHPPFFIHLSGPVGSGKTHVYTQLKAWMDKHIKMPFFAFGLDIVMTETPAYQKDLATHGALKAFQIWEIPARIVSYEILANLMRRHISVLFEHGGTPPSHLRMILEAQEAGYQTRYIYVNAPLETTLERVAARETDPNIRAVPKEMIFDRYERLQHLKHAYQAIFDHLEINNDTNTQISPAQIWADLNIKTN